MYLQYSGMGIGSEEELKREQLGVMGAGTSSPRTAADMARLDMFNPKCPAELPDGLPKLLRVSFGNPLGRSLRSNLPRGDSGSFCLVLGELLEHGSSESFEKSYGAPASQVKPTTRRGETETPDMAAGRVPG